MADEKLTEAMEKAKAVAEQTVADAEKYKAMEGKSFLSTAGETVTVNRYVGVIEHWDWDGDKNIATRRHTFEIVTTSHMRWVGCADFLKEHKPKE